MKTKTNLYLFLIALISAMGGFLFGYDWVVIGGAKPFYEQYFQIADSPSLQGWAMSSALIGCLIGALSAGKLSDKLGRKPILILAAGLFICTAVGTGAADTFGLFNVFRLIGGFAIGIASSLSPMYIAEIAPAHLRGRFVSINQLTVVLGILSAQIVNWQIAEPVADHATAEMIRLSWNGQMGWRWMFWAMVVPAALFFVFSFVLPESPRWLASSGYKEKAFGIFAKIGGEAHAREELAAIEAAAGEKTVEGGFKQLLHPSMRKILLIGVVMAVLQQWCGINVIFNYAQEIFMAAGYGVSDVLMNIVVTGVTNVIFTVLAMCVVDRWGRKALTRLRGVRPDADLRLHGRGLLVPYQRSHAARHRGGRHRLLRHDAGYDHVGHHLRNIPQPHTGRGHVGMHLRPLGRLLHPDVHLPSAEQRIGRSRDVLALWHHLPRRRHLRMAPPA